MASANSNYQWVQQDPTLNRDEVLQYGVNVHTGIRVWGKTCGFASDHWHLFYQNGMDSGLNLDPVSGEISRDGNVLGLIFAMVILGIAGAAGGALGAAEGGVAESAKYLFDPSNPSNPSILAGLIFPPAPKE